MPDTADDVLVEARNLKKYYTNKRDILGRPVHVVKAVDDVTFAINRGETLGVVGESGCGKSTLGRAMIRLLEPTQGDIFFKGINIASLTRKELREYRRDMQIIFQDPYASLNPMRTVFEAVREALAAARIGTQEERADRVAEALAAVGLTARNSTSIPMRCRAGSGSGSPLPGR
jgi:peptide/nickel transport system ATP-binding protein/oligopeptide transport system ATP-binding protein